VPRFASPATESPAMIATARGRKKGSVTVRPTSAANTPLWVIWSKKRGPCPGLGPSPEMRTATATATGTAARTSSSTREGPRRTSTPNSPSHIESLPSEPQDRVLEAAPVRRQAADADARHHEGAVALFGHLPVELGGDHLAGDDDGIETETLQHLDRVVGVGGLDTQHCVAPAAQLVDRSLRRPLAGRVNAEVVAQLLDLAQQVGRKEHSGSLGRELTDEVADLARSLRVHAVRGLVEDEEVAGPQERSCEAQPLLHPERVRPVALVGGGGEADLLQRGVDARGAGLALAVEAGGVEAPQGLPAGEPRI